MNLLCSRLKEATAGVIIAPLYVALMAVTVPSYIVTGSWSPSPQLLASFGVLPCVNTSNSQCGCLLLEYISHSTTVQSGQSLVGGSITGQIQPVFQSAQTGVLKQSVSLNCPSKFGVFLGTSCSRLRPSPSRSRLNAHL